MNALRRLRCLLVALPLALASGVAHSEEDYDMDCAVILCLVGGFPTGCAEAFDYMMDRIARFPPKPPFGFCLMGSPEDVEIPAGDGAEAARAALDQMEDAGVLASLQSVRVEVSRGTHTCTEGGQSGERRFNCTNMLRMNGDGSGLIIGDVEGWQSGQRVLFTDQAGAARSIGNAQRYLQTGETCAGDGGCAPVFGWVPIATAVTE